MRCGTVCFATEQGIGHLAKWFFEAGVVTDAVLYRHSSRTNHTEWYPPETPIVAVRDLANCEQVIEMVKKVDCLLFFETPFDWNILNVAHKFKKRTYIIPMYECCPRHIPVEPHKWLCPSLLDQRDYFPDHPYVPIPVPPDIKWQQRTRAHRFLHNGGHLGLRGHKGTLEILQSLEFVESPIELNIRVQDVRGFNQLCQLVKPEILKDSRLSVNMEGSIDYNLLFQFDDVFIMAEKYNGLSLPLAEAWASGMCVMTSDRFPMNTWLPTRPLIPVHRYDRACISGAYMEFAEAVVRPEDIAHKIDEMYDTDITEISLQGRAFREERSWENLKPVWMEELSK